MKKAFFLALLIAAAVFCSGNVGNNYATETRTHSVRIGETLWEIAWQYMPQQDKTKDVWELIYDIQQANKLDQKSAALVPGQKLIIPLARKVEK